MREYILTAAGVIFLTVLVSFILPEGKLNKIINFVMRIICIFVLIRPVTNLFQFSSQETAIVDYDYICSVYSDSQSQQLERLIYENYGLESECIVAISYSDGTLSEDGVTVFINDFVEEQTKLEIYEYLESLGYIDINVNEKTA